MRARDDRALMRRNGQPGQRNIYINGRFLEQPLSGVQRYAREMVLALDRFLGEEEEPDGHAERWTLLTAGKADGTLGLESIEVSAVHSLMGGHAWEQVALATAARGGTLLGFGGSGPILHSSQLVVIHDASVFRHPEFYSQRYGAWHRSLDRILARRARIATVSRFSQCELGEILGLVPDEIPVFYGGSDHMQRSPTSSKVVDRLQLRGRDYFVFVGNLSRNKNIGVALEALRQVPDAWIVLVGGLDHKIFGRVGLDISSERLLLAGRLDDSDLAGLMEEATGLLFPSRYEGFGIPPLEAMVHGCPVIASDIRAVKEVCENAALYFDPSNANQLAARMRELLMEPARTRQERCKLGRERAAQFTWQNSARAIVKFCRATLIDRSLARPSS